MALMQVCPKFELAKGAYAGERPVPMYTRARRVEFRSKGDLSDVVRMVSEGGRVEVEAAPAAGKSTRFPLFLAEQTGVLVVHVLPHPLMVVSLVRYLRKVAGSVPVHTVKDVASQWPSSGLVVVSAGLVAAKWLAAGRVEMPSCYLLHDESHESGFASAALRSLALEAEGVKAYVSLSATPGPGGARKMESGGKLYEQTYEPESFSDPWSVEEDGAPWAASSLEGHALLLEDDRHRAASLVEAYNYSGARAYRLHARMDEDKFEGVLNMLEDQRSAVPIVMVADSTFRSSYTFPLTLVVDSGLVRRVVVENGRPVRSVRPVYQPEVVQTRSRGSRRPGEVSTYWRPRAELPAKMCELEQTDAEALALVFRALGYAVPRYLANTRMATGPVPVDLYEALDGAIPLAALVASQLVDVKTVVEPQRLVRAQSPEVERVVDTYVPPPVVHAPGVTDIASAMDVARAVISQPDSGEAVFGKYYCAQGVYTSEVACLAFPDGVDSVKRQLAGDRSKTVQMSWGPVVRSVAVNLLVNSYNRDLLEVQAYAEVLNTVKRRLSAVTSQVRSWVTAVAERMSLLGARAEYSLGLANQVAADFCFLGSCDGLFDQERSEFVALVLQGYEGSAGGSVSSQADEVGRMRQWREAMASEAPRRQDYGSVRSREVAFPDASPAARNYTGFPVPRFVAWAGGAKYRSGSSSMGSTSSSSSGDRRYVAG